MLSKVKLNNTDLSVSQLCYGSNVLGTAINQQRANSLLDRFAELGGNFIDTARSYGDWVPDAPEGASERAIGEWLKSQRREDFVIATKGGQFDMRVGDWRNRVTAADLGQDLEESLTHLGVDFIDLYWLHADNPETPVSVIMDALYAFQAAGKIRWFGASNWTPQRIQQANDYAASVGKPSFCAVQPFWGLAVPNIEAAAAQGYQLYYEDGFQPLHEQGMAVIPYAGQSGGYFSKIAAGGADAVGEGLAARYDHPANTARFKAVTRVAERYGVTVNEVVLAYLTSQPQQTIPIFGGSTVDQISDSVKAASLRLNADDLAELRAE